MIEFGSARQVLDYLLANSVVIAPQLHLIIWGLGLLLLDAVLRGREEAFRRLTSTLFCLMGIGLASVHLAFLWASGAGPAFEGTITLDWFARFFDTLFLAAAFLTTLLSYRYLELEGRQHAEYYALLLFATSGMMFIAGALDLVTIFISLELMSISTYILVGFLKGRPRSTEASLKYFLLGAFSTGIILYGMSILYGVSGSTTLTGIHVALESLTDNTLVGLALLMVAAGLCFKVAAAPFHMWAPDAYEGAPTAITAYMSVAVKAAAFAVFLRFFYIAFADLRGVYLVGLVAVSALTMTWGNVAAVRQNNVKRLLAYSSISHAGYVLMALVSGSALGVSAAALYLFVYTFMNLGAWAILISLRREQIQGEEISDFEGLFSARPGLAVLMLIFLLSLAGIPPLGGFMAKYFVFGAAVQAGLMTSGPQSWLMFGLAVVGAANAVVALYYYLRIVVAMFIGSQPASSRITLSAGLTLTLWITGLLTVLTGVFPNALILLSRNASLPLL